MQNAIFTNLGNTLLSDAISGNDTITFSKVCISSHEYSSSDIPELTELLDVESTLDISGIKSSNNIVKITCAGNNSGLSSGYYVNTVALYAINEDDDEILLCVSLASSNADYVNDESTGLCGISYTFNLAMSNTQNVNLTVDPAAVATASQLQDINDDISSVSDSIDTLSSTVVSHVSSDILSQTGLHGIRYYNNYLELFDSTEEEWIEPSLKINDIYTSTLLAGSTSITISSSSITTNSILSFYTSIYGINPKSVSVSNGSVTLEFDSQDSNMIVGVKVDG